MKIKISDDFGSTPQSNAEGVWTFENESANIISAQGKYAEVAKTLPDGNWTLITNSKEG